MAIAYRLFVSVIVFAAHKFLRFITTKPKHDPEATVDYLVECNDWIESAKRTSHNETSADFILANQSEIRV